MDDLVGELLTLSRLETGNIPMEKEPLAIVPFMHQLVEDCQALAQSKHQSIMLDTGSLKPDARLCANEGYLYRAFDNVIRNAADSSANTSGTGLGLAIAKHIAEQHDAKLAAENAKDGGLKVRFVFPRTTRPKSAKHSEN